MHTRPKSPVLAPTPTDSWRVKVDDDISDLSKKMAGVESILSSVAHGMESLSHKFDKVQSAQVNNNRTQWPVILGSLMLVAVILGGFMGGYVRDLNRVETSERNLSSDFVEHIKDGHPGRLKAVFSARIEDFRTGLRNELNITMTHQDYLHSEINRRLLLLELRQFPSE